MKSVREFAGRHYPVIMVAVFAFISAVCLFLTSDDFIWYFVNDLDGMKEFREPNGRYLTNHLVIFLVKYPVFRTVFYTGVLTGMICFMAKLTDLDRKHLKTSCIAVFLLFLLIPAETYGEVLNWISGFPNYAFSFLLTAVYILYFFRVIFKKHEAKAYTLPLFLLMGAAVTLCVEHITIYNVLLAAVSVVIIKMKNKKLSLHSIFYLAGTVIGAAVMFSNGAYSQIGGEGDEVGNRGFHFSFADIYYNVFKFIVAHYSKEFWAVNAVIAGCLTFIVIKKGMASRKYAKICSLIMWTYTMYSFFTSCCADLVSTSYSMKFEALELAYAFLYIVSLAYLFYSYLEKDVMFRSVFYLISTVIVTAPFAIISPVTARCLFTNFMFWILLACEIMFAAVDVSGIGDMKYITAGGTAAAACMCVFFSGMNISNKYYSVQRIDFLRQQIDEGAKHYQFVELPYKEHYFDSFTSDSLFQKLSAEGDFSYGQLIFMYYGIDEGIDFDNISYNTITTSDYNLYISE